MIDLILDGLYISDAASVISAKGKNKMVELNIIKVLTSSAMPINENVRLPNVEYNFLFMMDCLNQDFLGNGILKKAINYIEESINNNQNILVHCEQGVSRSVALVAGYIMKSFKWNVEKSIMFIQKARPNGLPNSSFLQQLKIFEHVDYCLDPQKLLTSSLYKNYCADTGNIPVSISNQSEKSSSLNYDSTQNGLNNNIHYLADCARFSKQCFHCRRCRTLLFYDLNLIHHTIGGLKNYKSKLNNIKKQNFLNSGDELIKNEDNNNENIENSLIENQCCFEYLITPMKWMNLSEYQGKICCLKCKEKLGQYIWGGRVCLNENASKHKGSCGAFVVPWIHIKKCKVDVSNIKKLDQNLSLHKLFLHDNDNNKKNFVTPSVIITDTSCIEK